MNKDRRYRLIGISLAILITLVTADLAIRIWPGLVKGPIRFASEAHAQDSGSRPRTAPIFFPEFPIEEGRTRLFHVSYIVEDLEKSIAFYRDVLGFKHIRTQDMGFQRLGFISTGDGEPQIELKEVSAPFRGMPTEGFSHVLRPIFFPEFPIEEGRTRLFHVSYIVEDLEKSIAFYRDVLGFKHIRTQDMGFQRLGFISTGDGEPQLRLSYSTIAATTRKEAAFTCFRRSRERTRRRGRTCPVTWATRILITSVSPRDLR